MYHFLKERSENSICSPGQGEESSAGCFSDIPLSVLSRLNLTAGKSYCNDRETESCPSFQSGMMSEPSTVAHGEERSMSSAADFLAKTSVLQPTQKVEDREYLENEADYGPRCLGSFARFNPTESLWKTRQCLLLGGLESFSETWPDWGMMQDGESFALPTPGWTTNGQEYSLMPTITKAQIIEPEKPSFKINKHGSLRKYAKTGTEGSMSWCLWVLLNDLIPTPRAAEYIMGFPMLWTALEPLEMHKFQSWQQQHSGFFQKD